MGAVCRGLFSLRQEKGKRIMANRIIKPIDKQSTTVIGGVRQLSPPQFELLATTLPNGRENGVLRLTVLLSPRLLISLAQGQTMPELQLKYFRPVFDWPSIRKSLQFHVVFDGAGIPPLPLTPEWATAASPHNVDPFDADLWGALFPDTLLVRPYQFDQGTLKYTGDKFLIVAPAEKRFIQSVKNDLYGRLAVESPDRLPQKGLMLQRLQEMNLVKPDVRVPGKFERGFDHPILQLNILHDQLLKNQLGPGLQEPIPGSPSGQLGVTPPILSRGVNDLSIKRTLPRMSQQQLQTAGITPKGVELLKYQAVYEGTVLPKPRPQVPKVDFHQLISSLGDYPELMKRLGLRIDFRVNVDPKIRPASTVFVKVMAPAPVVPRVPTPRTKYILTGTGFQAATSSPELQDGLLTFGRQSGGVRVYDVVPGDVEGAFKRVAKFSELLLNPKKAEELAEKISLPALRSAGLSVAHNERDLWLDQLLERQKTMSSTPKSNLVFSGEDLIRGYRIDVREVNRQANGSVTFGPWRSLCFRHGEHRLAPNAPPVLTYNDEGWISLGATEGDVEPPPSVNRQIKPNALQPAPGVTPHIQSRAAMPNVAQSRIAALAAQAAVGAIRVVPKPILHIYESLFRWAGWSLCVPRPGKDLNPQDNPDYSGHVPIPGIPMQVHFTPIPGTLQRLRFGKQYQFRARVVDLAGNSLPVTYSPPENPLFVTDVNDGFYDRFEPVSSPVMVLTQPTKGPKPVEQPLLPGDFPARLVIRTLNLETPQDGSAGPATPISIRHIVPPRVSQELSEQHGMFDSLTPPQAHQLMTDKDLDLGEQWQSDPTSPIGRKAVKIESPEFVVPANQHITVPYLPDPLAAGVTFSELPGTTGNRLLLQPFAGNWPNRVGFKIMIEAGTAPPVFQGDTLKIFVPPGEHIRAEASCFFPPGSENLMGLWRWIQERMGHQSEGSSMLALVRQGRHWLLTPNRDLDLVHALQQPLFNPVWASLSNPTQTSQEVPADHVRTFGDTHAYLYGTLAVHRGSTEEFDLEARWSEPVDIGVPLTDPPQRVNGQAQAFQVPVVEQPTQRIIARGLEEQDGSPPLDIDLTERGMEATASIGDESLLSSTRMPLEPMPNNPESTAGETLPADEIQERGVPLAQLKSTPKVSQKTPVAAAATKVPPLVTPTQPQAPPPYDERPFRCATALPPLAPNLMPHQYRFAGKQTFTDTKYRCVDYVAIGKTRYRDYFLPTREEEETVWDHYEKAVAAAMANQRPLPPLPQLPKWTRSSQPVKVDILNSAPPAKPEVLYIIPTFRWENTPKGHRRVGGGLRVYLDRPWFSSGDGEQLAVVLYPDPRADIPDQAKPYVSQWGLDPLWESGPSRIPIPAEKIPINPKLKLPQVQPRSIPEDEIQSRATPPTAIQSNAFQLDPKLTTQILGQLKVGATHPAPSNFTNPMAVRFDLGVREAPIASSGVSSRAATLTPQRAIRPNLFLLRPMPVTICVFDVKPDVGRQLWYCDIDMDPGTAYFPFVRLALARYQVNSVHGAHLSPVVLADFAQLVPERTASVVPNPKDPNQIIVTIAGVQGSAAPVRTSEVEVIVEEMNPAIPDELGWIPIAGSKPTSLPRVNANEWSGPVPLPPPGPKLYRVVLKEFEVFNTSGEADTPRTEERRLVYADALPIKR